MIPFANGVVTLYNRRETKGEDGRTVVTWQRKELSRCSWTRRMERVRDGTTVVMTDVTVCRIPEDPAYCDPAAWDALTNPTGYFTLAPGDIIVRGVVFDLIGTLQPPSALIEKYKRSGVMTVTSATNNTRPGCFTGHYLAKGA